MEAAVTRNRGNEQESERQGVRKWKRKSFVTVGKIWLVKAVKGGSEQSEQETVNRPGKDLSGDVFYCILCP